MNHAVLHRWGNASADDVRAMPQNLYENVFAYFEDQNAHTENLVLQAKRFGTGNQIEEAHNILAAHRRLGYLDGALYERARILRRALDKHPH